MAQCSSVLGQYLRQDVHYSTSSHEYCQTHYSSKFPPPYLGNGQGHDPTPPDAKMDHDTRTSMQHPQVHSKGPYQQPMAIQQSFSRRLHHQPIVIPQTAPGGNNPFIRTYSPVLCSHNISLSTFLAFLDTLNVCLANTPPLQVLDLAGGIVGMVPHHIPALIGSSLQATAKLASAVTSKTRVANLLKSANEEIFAPQRLKVEIVNTETLKQKLGLDSGKPLLGELDEQGLEMSVRDRRLQALEPCVAALDFNVPEPARRENVIDRLSASQLKRQMAKSEGKAMEARKKDHEKKNNRAEKEDRKAEKDRKKGKEREAKKEKDDKESKAAEKLLWLFIAQV